MKTLIDAAGRRGLQVMEGFVLAENESMLRLAKRLGFSIAPDPEDRAVRICRLQLGDWLELDGARAALPSDRWSYSAACAPSSTGR